VTGAVAPSRANKREPVALENGGRAEIERLASRNAGLERSVEELERFVFIASHDLQESLRTITAYAQLLARKCHGPLDTESAWCVDKIVDGATRMRELLTDLLAYSELGSHPQGAVGPVNLNSVVESVTENLKASIDENHAVVTSEPLPILNAQASDFIPLFQNLLANALKYRGKRPPRIHISVQRMNGQLRFAVSDNGIGIDRAHHRQIFEPFKRLHGKNIPGTGLGLAICERVIQRYAGRIWVESRAGEGATFLFTLPDTSLSSAVES